MTRVLLCAGPGLLVVEKGGLLFLRRPGQPDTLVPYAPEHYPVFLSSAKRKHDLSPVLGAGDDRGPVIPEGTATPALRMDRLPSGEVVYRLVESEGARCDGVQKETLAPGESGAAAPTTSAE